MSADLTPQLSNGCPSGFMEVQDRDVHASKTRK